MLTFVIGSKTLQTWFVALQSIVTGKPSLSVGCIPHLYTYSIARHSRCASRGKNALVASPMRFMVASLGGMYDAENVIM